MNTNEKPLWFTAKRYGWDGPPMRVAGMGGPRRMGRVGLWNCVSDDAPAFRSLDGVDSGSGTALLWSA